MGKELRKKGVKDSVMDVMAASVLNFGIVYSKHYKTKQQNVEMLNEFFREIL